MAEALRRLADADPDFAQRVLDATLAERRENAELEIQKGAWVLWYGRLMRTWNVSTLAEWGLVEVLDPMMWDNRINGRTFESDAAPRHQLRVLTDEEGQRRRAESVARGY